MNSRFTLPAVAILLSVVFVFQNARATVHTVTFICCEYTPSNFSASVGDTVVWEGNFAAHPLESTTIPPGADPFSNSTGTLFSYVIQVAGTYNYHCVFHQPVMAGSFSATTMGVVQNDGRKPSTFQLYQNYPNPFNPSTVIRYSLPANGNVVLKVYNVLGNEVATLVNEKKEGGTHAVEFDGSTLPSGIYTYRIQSGEFTATKKLLLLK